MTRNQKSIILLLTFVVFPFLQAFAQNAGSVEGSIKSDDGLWLLGASIIVKGTDNGTVSDIDGNFLLQEVASGVQKLEIRLLGYQTKTYEVNVRAGQTEKVEITLQSKSMDLSEVTVKGGGLKVRNRTATVNTVSAEEIRKQNFNKAETIVEEVPGVEIADYSQGGTASTFSMRGFGEGGHGGDIAVQIDGVSLNESEGHGDGYADMNVIIPLNIGKVDIYKGPSSVLFGNFANGGAISFETRKGGNYTDLSLSGGSFDTFDAQIALGKSFELNNDKVLKTNFAAQLYRTNGFMSNSDMLRGNLHGRLAYDLTDKTEIALTLSGHTSNWGAPGFIPGNSELPGGDQFFNGDPYKQAIYGENDGGEKSFASERIDINHSFNDNLRLLVYGYSVQQDFTRFSKWGIETPGGQSEDLNDRNVYSIGGSLNGDHYIGSVEMDWVVGTEFYNEFTDKTTWATSNRVRASETPDALRMFRIQTYSAFGQAEFDISPYFRPSVGFRFDSFDGTLKMRDPGSVASDENLNKQSHISPKLGFRSTLVDNLDFRFNASNGFTLPSGIERYSSDMDVDPIELWQYEAGFNYQYSDWLDLDLVGYILDSSSEINEIIPGSGEFVNSGKTQRRGVEFGAKANPVSGLYLNGSYSYVSTEIKDNPDADMIGNSVAGIPSTILRLSAEYVFDFGLGLNYRFRDLGKYPTGIDNAYYYKGYTLSDVKVFYDFKMKSNQSAQVYLEVNNMYDSKYATVAFDNFFPTEGGQLFAPGVGRNFTLGVKYSL